MKAIVILAMMLMMNPPSMPEPLESNANRNAHQLTRAGDPAFTVRVPAGATYVGADRFELYGVADAEIHVFVEADTAGHVAKLYWIQFEQYLPSNEHRYDYADGNTRRRMWGLDFWTSAGFSRIDRPARPGSDRESVLKLVRAAGYTLPPHMMSVRLVHLPDDPATGRGRRELMLIYAEDLVASGRSAEQLTTAGEPNADWPPLAEALIQRAQAAITVKRS